MARTIQQIQNQINAQLSDNSLFGSFFTPPPSMTSLWGNFVYVIAYCIQVFEQLLDAYQVNIQATVANNYPCTPAWIVQQLLNFQYSASSPQVLALINFAPAYPTINTSLRIITSAAVVFNQTLPGAIIIKVTNNGAALTSGQLTALNSYLTIIMPPQISWTIISSLADYAMIGGSVYFDGSYSETDISSAVEATLNTLITTLGFNGTIQVSDIIDAVRSTAGVNDFVPSNIAMRPNAVIAANATIIVRGGQTLVRNYQSYSGLLIADTGSGRTFADTLTYIAE